MKKLESLKSEKFTNLESSKVSNLAAIVGGANCPVTPTEQDGRPGVTTDYSSYGTWTSEDGKRRVTGCDQVKTEIANGDTVENPTGTSIK